MSVYSEAVSVCSRTADFSFCLDNPAFSDAVLVLLTPRPRPPSSARRIISSVAQLWLAAAQVTANTVASSLQGTVPASDTVSKLLEKYGPDVVGSLTPKASDELAVARIFQVNSAILAASSPYLRQLIQHSQQLLPELQRQVPGLLHVAHRHRQKRVVAVVVQQNHLAAAEAVVRFIFTNDIRLSGSKDALDALLVAEQLQVPDCAEVCQHYIDGCADMEWQVALTLVHLQHKHQQVQRRQQQQQQPNTASRSASSGASTAGSRSALQLLQAGLKVNVAEAAAPPLPVPSDSLYLQHLLLRAQDFLLQQFDDLELVMQSAEGREKLLVLPYDALRAVLAHPKLKVASENTVLLAAAGWLGANVNQAAQLLLVNPGAGSNVQGVSTSITTASAATAWSASDAAAAAAAEGDATATVMQAARSTLCADVSPAKQAASPGAAAATAAHSPLVAEYAISWASTTENGSSSDDTGNATEDTAASQPSRLPTEEGAAAANTSSSKGSHRPNCQQQAHNNVTQQELQQQQQEHCSNPAAELLVDLCRVLRLRHCSYTFIMQVLPQLPSFREHPELVRQLQFDVLRYQAAGRMRQQRLAAAAAAALSLSEGALENLTVAAERTVGGNAAPPAAAAGPAAASPAVLSGGWRSSGPVVLPAVADHPALVPYQPRPASSVGVLDFKFTFDAQELGSGSSSSSFGSREAATGWSAARSLLHGAAAAAAAGSAGNSNGVAVSALLGLAQQQHQQPDTLMSSDHYFAGYVWNMVVAADGFVGVHWRVVLPSGEQVHLPAPPAATSSSSSSNTADDDLDVPEVAVTFSISGTSSPSRRQGSSNRGSSRTAVAGGATDTASRLVGDVAAAAVAPAGGGSSAVPAGSSSPAKPRAQARPATGKAYTEVQFVPAQCAWGFVDFAGPGGWEAWTGPDGKVTLRCLLSHRE